jgi:hypothetical protein
MTTKLDPPPVPPLSPSQREDLRRRVMSGVDEAPRNHRRWVAPVVAVAAVSGVVAGTLAITNRAEEVLPAPPAAASPSTPVVDKSKIVRVAKDFRIDLGPATAAEAARAARNCQFPGVKRTSVLWSRKVSTPSPGRPNSGVMVLTKATPGQPGTTYKLGLFACFVGGGTSAVRDSAWREQPSAARGGVTLALTGSVAGDGRGGPSLADFQALHRIRPEIARVQSRLVWGDGHGQWIEGVVAGGFAFTHSAALIPSGQYKPPAGDGQPRPGDPQEEYRAWDAEGRVVPLTP